MNIVKTCVLRPFSYTFGFDFGLFYENKNFLEGRNRYKRGAAYSLPYTLPTALSAKYNYFKLC